MRALRTASTVLLRAVALWVAVGLLGCPPGVVPSRDGGRACTRAAECTPGGASCGVVFECVVGFCAQTPIVRACPDGSYPSSDASTGNCVLSEDCNPPGACGAIVACVNYVCDPDGPRINVPCPDAGRSVDASVPPEGGADASAEAAAPMDARADLDARDASTDGANEG
jgi:hypothetical protein